MYCGKKGRTDRTQHSAVTATDKLVVGNSSVLLKQRPAPHQSAKLSLLVLLLVVAGVMAATAVTGRRCTTGVFGCRSAAWGLPRRHRCESGGC
jgi:hypothetical protein